MEKKTIETIREYLKTFLISKRQAHDALLAASEILGEEGFECQLSEELISNIVGESAMGQMLSDKWFDEESSYILTDLVLDKAGVTEGRSD